MARAEATKAYNTFVRGLITEASPLSFPENASLDEENCKLNHDGSRQRRLGIDYEDNYSVTATAGYNYDRITSVHPWGEDLVVVQTGSQINVLDADTSTSLYSINLSSSTYHDYLNSPGIGNEQISVAVIPGKDTAIITSSEIHPTKIINTSGVFSTEVIEVNVRDFEGVDYGVAVDYRPTAGIGNNLSLAGIAGTFEYDETVTQATTSATGKVVRIIDGVLLVKSVTGVFSPGYVITGAVSGATATVTLVTIPDDDTTNLGNLYNQGWDFSTITTFKNALGVYPSNADIAYLGKDSSDVFTPSLLLKQYFGNTPAPKGKNIYQVAGDNTYPPINTASINNVAFYANRAFYSSTGLIHTSDTNYVLFSQQLTDLDRLGLCHQEADPTSEHISDLLPTDGGSIPLPDVGNIFKLVAIAEALLIFADNGVWQILGNAEAGFTADSFQLIKISDVGALSASSIVLAEDTIFYFTKAGIYAATRSQGSAIFTTSNLTENTIQTEYNSISNSALENTFGIFEPTERKLHWLYNSNPSFDGSLRKTIINSELILDLTLGAFYKYTYSNPTGNFPALFGAFISPSFASLNIDEVVTVSGTAVTVSGIDVTIGLLSTQTNTSRIKYVNFTTAVGNFSTSELKDTTFTDWVTYNGIGADFTSYLDTGYELLGDTSRDKQATYITTHFNRTENGYELDGNGNLVLKNPSSCMLQARWGWSDSTNSGRWGNTQQVYRFKRDYIPTGVGDTFDYGFSVITNKTKLRGKGEALSLHFESETGKDMQLLGWSIPFTGNTEV